MRHTVRGHLTNLVLSWLTVVLVCFTFVWPDSGFAVEPAASSVSGEATSVVSSAVSKSLAGDRSKMPLAITEAKACEAAKASASTACLESLSPDLQNGIAAINGLMSGADMLGVNNVCSKYRKAMDLAKTAMTAYSAACAYFKYTCDTTCQTSAKTITQSSTQLNAEAIKMAALAPHDPNREDLPNVKLDQATLASMQKENVASQAVCGSYKLQLASAAIGGAALMKKFTTAQKCEEDSSTVNCALTPMDPKCVVVAVDCTKSENNTKIECICLKNPRTAGCGGDASTSGNSVMASSQGSLRSSTSSDALPDPNFSVSQDLSPSLKAGDIPGSGAGGGAGGGAAPGSGSSGGKGADNAKGGVQTKSGFNTNILSGDSGGGGGGGGYRGGGGSTDSDNYKAYLPGGAKDPTRALASPNQGAVDVTGSGGADNWTKVTNRYRDNKPTLMGE
jgi:hypothetical protein